MTRRETMVGQLRQATAVAADAVEHRHERNGRPLEMGPPLKHNLPSEDDWNELDQRTAKEHGWLLRAEAINTAKDAQGLGYFVRPYGPRLPNDDAHIFQRLLYSLMWGDRIHEQTAVRAVRAIAADEFTVLLQFAENGPWTRAWKPENRLALVNRLRTIRKSWK